MTANRKIASLTPGSDISETGHKDISAARLAAVSFPHRQTSND